MVTWVREPWREIIYRTARELRSGRAIGTAGILGVFQGPDREGLGEEIRCSVKGSIVMATQLRCKLYPGATPWRSDRSARPLRGGGSIP